MKSIDFRIFRTNWIPDFLPIGSLWLETSATALCGPYVISSLISFHGSQPVNMHHSMEHTTIWAFFAMVQRQHSGGLPWSHQLWNPAGRCHEGQKRVPHRKFFGVRRLVVVIQLHSSISVEFNTKKETENPKTADKVWLSHGPKRIMTDIMKTNWPTWSLYLPSFWHP